MRMNRMKKMEKMKKLKKMKNMKSMKNMKNMKVDEDEGGRRWGWTKMKVDKDDKDLYLKFSTTTKHWIQTYFLPSA